MATVSSEAKSFNTLPPNVSSDVKPFKITIPDDDVKHMLALLKLSPIAGPLYENSLPDGDRHLGLRRDWLVDAKKYWEDAFDWKDHESYLNTFPNFTAPVTDTLGSFSIHFAALFSRRPDAIPIIMLHGWPGSFVEFLGILDLLRRKYSPETLPYHVIVPSLPGYGFSSAQAVEKDFSQADAARVMDSLMVKALGFAKEGYVVQGGDVGSRIARIMAVEHPSCKAVHLNFSAVSEPESPIGTISATEQAGLQRWQKWKATGSAYAQEHGTRPSTIGFVLSSSPLALLAWVGEKFLDWTDVDPDLETIVASASLYWLTKTAHSSLWSYRHSYGPNARGHDHPDWNIRGKPFGYSYFPKELIPVPVAWVATTGDLVWSKIHESGGHFAAMEEPEALWGDVEAFVGEFGLGMR